MDRLAHLASAQANLKTATELTGAGLPDQAGEIFWGAIVQNETRIFQTRSGMSWR